MNATEIFRQSQRLKGPNGQRVPRLARAPKHLQELYLKLGTARFVASFETATLKNRTTLRIVLREGEIPNIVVGARLKQLFKGHGRVKFLDNFETQPVAVEIYH